MLYLRSIFSVLAVNPCLSDPWVQWALLQLLLLFGDSGTGETHFHSSPPETPSLPPDPPVPSPGVSCPAVITQDTSISPLAWWSTLIQNLLLKGERAWRVSTQVKVCSPALNAQLPKRDESLVLHGCTTLLMYRFLLRNFPQAWIVQGLKQVLMQQNIYCSVVIVFLLININKFSYRVKEAVGGPY